MTPLLARLLLARTEGIGPQWWRRLVERHGGAAAALEALPGYGRRGMRYAVPPREAVEREIEAVARLGGRFLFADEEGYPRLLGLLPDAPAVLAVIGDVASLSAPAVAVVGARNASAGGRRIAEDLAEGLAGRGLVVVSGLARGIDAAAHRGAMRAGLTVAVLPGGLDVAYPPEHAGLQAEIGQAGAVVAEAPLGTAPLARHFPKRNRIVAGLALGVVVIEAAERSGTLITARMGLEAGREIFAVPGSPLDPRSRGANDLIRQGAHLVERVEDVLENLPEAPREGPLFRPAGTLAALPETAPEPPAGLGDNQQVYDLVGSSPVSVDELARRCHLTAPELQAVLTELEMEGRVQLLPGGRVLRSGSR